MSDEKLKHTIALTQIKGVGPTLAKNLIAYLGDPELVFKEKKQNLAKIPGIGNFLSEKLVSQRQIALERAERELYFIQKNGIETHSFFDKNYPFRLKECSDAPLLLYSKGESELNKGKFIAIVGTRKASERGKENCKNLIYRIAQDLPSLTIVSGLAFGIDAAAHKNAIDFKLSTIAVLGHGLDRIYPNLHLPLAKQIVTQGCLLTEFLSETQPDRPNFVQRNRIIAGLCDATIVIESKEQGGALITANLANDYNRDVFAFPGRIDDEFSKGCNALIKRNKAALIESADDILNFMNWKRENEIKTQDRQTSLFLDLNEEAQALLSVLRQHPDGMQINELSVQLNKPFSKMSALLLDLEFKNLVKCLPGNIYRIIK